jgi:riboflavin synthase
MFTGIISEIGEVVGTRPFTVRALNSAAGLTIGGSIAVNGACLTATQVDDGTFTADVVDETLRRTNLGDLNPGSRVNLELPLAAGRPLDGHLVQGHVDATTRVTALENVESGREATFGLPRDLAVYIAEKGSVAVDGISLTVAAVDGDFFKVALIPHTLEETIAKWYDAGTVVNIEVDLVARYLERLVRLGIGKG